MTFKLKFNANHSQTGAATLVSQHGDLKLKDGIFETDDVDLAHALVTGYGSTFTEAGQEPAKTAALPPPTAKVVLAPLPAEPEPEPMADEPPPVSVAAAAVSDAPKAKGKR